jgi:23S rRNA pseudouridine1911/1915/1917 synthase
MPQIYEVPAETRRARADKALARVFPEHSRTAIQRAFEAGLVLRNGRVITKSDVVAPGDTLCLDFAAVVPANMAPYAIPLDILFEDKHFLALNKAAGMVVHPGAGTGPDTLVHALLAHCAGQLSGIGGVERPGIVHRLDRETSGLILVAKTDAAHRGLSTQFAERTVRKEYLAIVGGVPELLSGSIRKGIGRNPHQRHKMAVFEPGQGGRDAHTDWTLVERFADRASLLRCVLHTGRTHQIRVHLKSLGLGLLGDTVYGYKPDPQLDPAPLRVMLHAEHLVLQHPISGKALDLRAPVPADFRALLAGLRVRAIAFPQRPAKASAAKPHRKL